MTYGAIKKWYCTPGYGIYYDRISTRYANTQLFNYPYFGLGVGLVNSPLFPILPGTFRPASDPFIHLPLPSAFPVAPTVPSPLTPLAPVVGVPISGVFVNPDLETPYIQQYNLGAQVELAHNLVAEFGFIRESWNSSLASPYAAQPADLQFCNQYIFLPAGCGLLSEQEFDRRYAADPDNFCIELQFAADVVDEALFQRRTSVPRRLYRRTLY